MAHNIDNISHSFDISKGKIYFNRVIVIYKNVLLAPSYYYF